MYNFSLQQTFHATKKLKINAASNQLFFNARTQFTVKSQCHLSMRLSAGKPRTSKKSALL